MAKPLVAIVGRPNVGKSMLFNKLTGKRLSIVEDTPGVTRDRLYAQAEWRGRTFDLVDTGGIEPGTDDQILSFMREQAEIAIAAATVIVFVCDIRTGMTAADQEVAGMLQRSRKPVVPPVSTRSKVRPRHSAWAYSLSRVTPGVSSTMERRFPVNLLNSMDLPTFGRPTMATRGFAMKIPPWGAGLF